MKILVIHLKEEKETFKLLAPYIKEMDIAMEVLSLKSPNDMNMEKFMSIFDSGNPDRNKASENTPVFILILSPLSRSWFDFLAGFSCGSHLHLLVYGQEAIFGISKEFASFFTFINTDASLKNFLEVELEVYKKQEAAREVIRAQERLLEMGVPVNGEALTLCVSEGRLLELSLFIAAGFTSNTRNKLGVPLLNIAARDGRREIVNYLLLADAEVNAKAEDRGTTALIDSVMRKHFDIMADLIKAGTDVNIQSRDGQTALIVAVGIGNEEPVEALLKAGSNPDLPDSMGVTARQYAALFYKDKLGKYFDIYSPLDAEKTG